MLGYRRNLWKKAGVSLCSMHHLCILMFYESDLFTFSRIFLEDEIFINSSNQLLKIKIDSFFFELGASEFLTHESQWAFIKN